MFYAKLQPLINVFYLMLRLLWYSAQSLMNLIYQGHSWIWYIAALHRIHNRGIWIKRHRIDTNAYVAYVLIIEACKEIQDYTLCCSSHSLLTHEPLINLSWTTHKQWASHVHWHEWCRFWVEGILSIHRKAISVTFLEFPYSESYNEDRFSSQAILIVFLAQVLGQVPEKIEYQCRICDSSFLLAQNHSIITCS